MSFDLDSFAEKEFHITHLFSSKVFCKDYLSGDLYLNLDLLKEFDTDAYNFFVQSPKTFIELSKREIKHLFEPVTEKKDPSGNLIEASTTPKNFINFKIKNFNKTNEIFEIREDYIGKVVNFKGIITKITKVIAIPDSSSYECPSCGSIFKSKNKVDMCSCGRRSLRLVSQDLRDVQEIEIEEPQDEIDNRQPQKIIVRLYDELTNKSLSGLLQPGNRVSVLGIVEKLKIPKKNEELYEYRIEAIGVDLLDERFFEENISEEDMERIYEIANSNPLEKLSSSLAPNIIGNEDVKKALVLQMIGGVKREKKGGTSSRERIHILLCGDASSGKTNLAKNVCKRMPKSYYVSGDSASKVGLLASVDRDTLTNAWQLKSGALCKGSGGIVVIDEMDKLSDEDRQGLHTPMESAEIVVNKADIHVTLKADCSILGISNPKDGMFDNDGHIPLTKQLNLPPPLLSRFDLVFAMVDLIDSSFDEKIIESIYLDDKKEDFIPINLFRKYIYFAKKLNPKRMKENIQYLSSFYAEIRKKSTSPNSKLKGMPITPRHAEGIFRLAEASAKLRLSEKVEKEDIDLAKDLFYKSLIKLGMNEDGVFDLARIGEGKPLSKRAKFKGALELIEKMSKDIGNLIPDDLLREEMKKNGFFKYEIEEIISEMNKENMLLQRGKNWEYILQ